MLLKTGSCIQCVALWFLPLVARCCRRRESTKHLKRALMQQNSLSRQCLFRAYRFNVVSTKCLVGFHCSRVTCQLGFAAQNPTCSVALPRWKRWRSWFCSFCRCKKQRCHRYRAFLLRCLNCVTTLPWLVCLQRCCPRKTLYRIRCKQSATSLASWASFCKYLTSQG